MPINNDEALNDNIFIGVPNNGVVNKNSKLKAEAKEFLNWLVTSDIGMKYTVKEFKFIPAFTDIPFEAADLGNIATAVQDYSFAGKTLSWYWAKLPDGSTQQFEASIQAYIARHYQQRRNAEAVG